MKFGALVGVMLAATAPAPMSSAEAASIPVSLYAAPLTLSRTVSVTVDLSMQDGTGGQIHFSAEDIGAGAIAKPFDAGPAATIEQISACTATWRFEPLAGDMIPAGGETVDNVGFECSVNSGAGVVEIIPLTAVRSLTVTVPAVSFASRGATELRYTLKPTQIHGPAWKFAEVAVDVTPGDRTIEHFAFTAGCLSYALTASWRAEDGTVVTDVARQIIGETYTVE